MINTSEVPTNSCSAECCITKSSRCLPEASTLKGKGRNFRLEWAEKYQWITYCKTRNAVFCFLCRQAASEGLVKKSLKDGHDVFSEKGFSNWRKALEKFQAHETSTVHCEAAYKIKCKKTDSVLCQMTIGLENEQAKRRCTFLKVINFIRFLARQGLPLRGHDEQESNLMQILQSVCNAYNDTLLQNWIHKGIYLSHDIVNEILEIMSRKCVKSIVQEVAKCRYYGILADETRDESRKEQLVFCLRWVNDVDYAIHEEPIGLYLLDSTSSEHLEKVVLDILLRMGLDMSNLRGQGYDGAATMSGAYTGLAKRILSHESRAVYVHCAAHNLQLVLQDCSKVCTVVKGCLDFVQELTLLIRRSPKRLTLFNTLRLSSETEEFSQLKSSNLKPLCPTRWTVRNESMRAVEANYMVLQDTLEIISTENTDAARTANGLKHILAQFSQFFGLKLCIMIFSAAEEMSKALQNKTISNETKNIVVKNLLSYYSQQRTEEAFNSFWKNVVKSSSNLTDSPKLPRQRKIPARLGGNPNEHHFATPEDFFRKEYFQTLDSVIHCLEERFSDNEGFQKAKLLEKLLISIATSPREFGSDEKQFLEEQKDVDCKKLLSQAALFPDFLKSVADKHTLGIKNVTSVSTICDILTLEPEIVVSLFSEIHKLLLLFLTYPVTTATAERTFSALRRTKTYLRNTMTQIRLNSCLILQVHKNLLDNVNITEIAAEFSSRNEKRRSFFGLFK